MMRLRRLCGKAYLWVWGVAGSAAHAGGSSMPWEAPLQSILDSVQGPVAKILGALVIFATGFAMAVGDTTGGFRKLLQIVLGLSIAFTASSFFLDLFGYSGGATIGAGS